MYRIFPRRYDWMSTVVVKLGGGFWNIFGMFTPKIGEDEPIFDERMFLDRVVQPLFLFTRNFLWNDPLDLVIQFCWWPFLDE